MGVRRRGEPRELRSCPHRVPTQNSLGDTGNMVGRLEQVPGNCLVPTSRVFSRGTSPILADFLDVPPLADASGVRYPGQGMLATRQDNLEKGVLVDAEIWETVRNL